MLVHEYLSANLTEKFTIKQCKCDDSSSATDDTVSTKFWLMIPTGHQRKPLLLCKGTCTCMHADSVVINTN